MKKKLALFLLVPIVVIVIFYVRRTPPVVKTITPTRQDLSQILTASGKVSATEMVDLQFQTSGLLAWVGVKEGDLVKKYQAIASLDKRQLQKNLQSQLNTYLTHRADFEQTQDNYKATKDQFLVTDAIKRILDKAQYDLNNSVINVELQDLALKLATITTPIEGIVTNITAPFSGVNIIPSQASFQIINPKTVYFSAQIDETDIAKIAPDQTVQITLDAFPSQTFTAKIESLSFIPRTDTTGTTYEAKISLPVNTDNRFKVGLNGEANITTKVSLNALTLPINAFTSLSGNRGKLDIKQNGKIVPLEVTTGIITDNDVEVLSGLAQNDQVVLPQTNGQKTK